MSSSMGRMTSNIWNGKNHVPNHQQIFFTRSWAFYASQHPLFWGDHLVRSCHLFASSSLRCFFYTPGGSTYSTSEPRETDNQAGVSRHVFKKSEKNISIQAVQLLLTARSMARVALVSGFNTSSCEWLRYVTWNLALTKDFEGNIMANLQYPWSCLCFVFRVDWYVTIYIMLYPFMVTKQDIYHSTWITWLYIDESMELKPIRAIVKTW